MVSAAEMNPITRKVLLKDNSFAHYDLDIDHFIVTLPGVRPEMKIDREVPLDRLTTMTRIEQLESETFLPFDYTATAKENIFTKASATLSLEPHPQAPKSTHPRPVMKPTLVFKTEEVEIMEEKEKEVEMEKEGEIKEEEEEEDASNDPFASLDWKNGVATLPGKGKFRDNYNSSLNLILSHNRRMKHVWPPTCVWWSSNSYPSRRKFCTLWPPNASPYASNSFANLRQLASTCIDLRFRLASGLR